MLTLRVPRKSHFIDARDQNRVFGTSQILISLDFWASLASKVSMTPSEGLLGDAETDISFLGPLRSPTSSVGLQ
jgi:hypothetical protein